MDNAIDKAILALQNRRFCELLDKDDFSRWFKDLKKEAFSIYVGVNSFLTQQEVDRIFCDADAWKTYYENGLTPRQALLEEIAYGD